MELLHDPRIQETAKLAVKNQASKDKSWEYQVLADDFYKWAKIFNDELKEKDGTSTLHKWECPECRFAVNATTKFDIKVHCGQCEQTPPPLMVRAVRK